MRLTGQSVPEISERLASAHVEGEKVSSIDLAPLDRILHHTPEDMTVCVEAGMPLNRLQDHLAGYGQWLPIDPPRSERLTVGELVSMNLSGPRRYGYGTIREHLIGITVVLADGRIIKSGGRVVKNVAGYDLCKLFVGHRDTLGVIVEVNFKLQPKPETELFLQCRPDSPRAIQDLLQAIRQSPMDPVVLDLDAMGDSLLPTVVVGFAGSEAQVDWQRDWCGDLGFTRETSLDYETRFWNLPPEPTPRSISVLPSQLLHALPSLQNAPWIARAGNGLIWHRGAGESSPSRLPTALLHRVKSTFDPNQIFPAIPW